MYNEISQYNWLSYLLYSAWFGCVGNPAQPRTRRRRREEPPGGPVVPSRSRQYDVVDHSSAKYTVQGQILEFGDLLVLSPWTAPNAVGRKCQLLTPRHPQILQGGLTLGEYCFSATSQTNSLVNIFYCYRDELRENLRIYPEARLSAASAWTIVDSWTKSFRYSFRYTKV